MTGTQNQKVVKYHDGSPGFGVALIHFPQTGKYAAARCCDMIYGGGGWRYVIISSPSDEATARKAANAEWSAQMATWRAAQRATEKREKELLGTS